MQRAKSACPKQRASKNPDCNGPGYPRHETCVMMAAPVFIDIAGRAVSGEWTPALILIFYILAGAAIYVFYGHKHAHIRAKTLPAEAGSAG